MFRVFVGISLALIVTGFLYLAPQRLLERAALEDVYIVVLVGAGLVLWEILKQLYRRAMRKSR